MKRTDIGLEILYRVGQAYERHQVVPGEFPEAYCRATEALGEAVLRRLFPKLKQQAAFRQEVNGYDSDPEHGVFAKRWHYAKRFLGRVFP